MDYLVASVCSTSELLYVNEIVRSFLANAWMVALHT